MSTLTVKPSFKERLGHAYSDRDNAWQEAISATVVSWARKEPFPSILSIPVEEIEEAASKILNVPCHWDLDLFSHATGFFGVFGFDLIWAAGDSHLSFDLPINSLKDIYHRRINYPESAIPVIRESEYNTLASEIMRVRNEVFQEMFAFYEDLLLKEVTKSGSKPEHRLCVNDFLISKSIRSIPGWDQILGLLVEHLQIIGCKHVDIRLVDRKYYLLVSLPLKAEL